MSLYTTTGFMSMAIQNDSRVISLMADHAAMLPWIDALVSVWPEQLI